jgi:hypothetical protein
VRAKRAAAIVALIRSAQSKGHEPHACVEDVLAHLPAHKAGKSASCYLIAGEPSVSHTAYPIAGRKKR